MSDDATRKPPAKRTPRKRAAKKTTSPAKLAAVTPLEPAGNTTLLEVLEGAIKTMDWLVASDEAMVELAREYCRRIDDTKRIAEEWDAIAGPLRELAEISESKALVARLIAVEKALDVSKQIGWLGPHLANTLRDIGGAPAERKGLTPDAPVTNRLAQLRQQAVATRKAPRAR